MWAGTKIKYTSLAVLGLLITGPMVASHAAATVENTVYASTETVSVDQQPDTTVSEGFENTSGTVTTRYNRLTTYSDQDLTQATTTVIPAKQTSLVVDQVVKNSAGQPTAYHIAASSGTAANNWVAALAVTYSDNLLNLSGSSYTTVTVKGTFTTTQTNIQTYKDYLLATKTGRIITKKGQTFTVDMATKDSNGNITAYHIATTAKTNGGTWLSATKGNYKDSR
ncbi:hypothetical protein ACFQ5M_02860 [Agrilactobacillus yilanensis]|uniref:Uncharacterized protein n=1 Tax=Agrilactobacillus yilanensis TaxID=2485997 RepID=A0ABW4J5V6_9LACO|nr:hypothetical protein [Agrilactobacillus yilanensis]